MAEYYAYQGLCLCPRGGRLPQEATPVAAPFHPLLYLVIPCCIWWNGTPLPMGRCVPSRGRTPWTLRRTGGACCLQTGGRRKDAMS